MWLKCRPKLDVSSLELSATHDPSRRAAGALRARLAVTFQACAQWLDPSLREAVGVEPMAEALLPAPEPLPEPAPLPPSGPDLKELTNKAEHLLEEARRDVLGRIKGVNETSEREVLAVGGTLQAIVTESQEQVRDLKRTLALLSGGGSRVGVPQLAAQQSHSVRDYLEKMGSIMAAHDRTVKGAEAASQRIADIGRSVEKVAFQARLLSLNAAIEAARLGGHGSAFGVLAEEMTRLSTEMDGANRQVRDLAQSLLGSLPEISKQSEDMRGAASDFSEHVRRGLTDLEQSSREFEASVTEALTRGDERSARVVSSSQDALSHLSFQDACAQRLLSVDAVLRRLAGGVRDMLADPSADAAASGFSKIHRSDEHFAGDVIALRQPGEGDDDGAAAPGEMMLF